MNGSHLGEGLSDISWPQEDGVDKKRKQTNGKSTKKYKKYTQQPSALTEWQTH